MPKLTTPEKRARMAAYMRERRKDPAVRERARAAARKYGEKNREKIRAYNARPENREKRRLYLEKKRRRPEFRLKHATRHRERVESTRLAEAGRPRPDCCDVCGGNENGIVFDHCHQRGVFRGWICQNCNVALGCVKDDPNRLRKLIAYLERTAKLVPPQLSLPGL